MIPTGPLRKFPMTFRWSEVTKKVILNRGHLESILKGKITGQIARRQSNSDFCSDELRITNKLSKFKYEKFTKKFFKKKKSKIFENLARTKFEPNRLKYILVVFWIYFALGNVAMEISVQFFGE